MLTRGYYHSDARVFNTFVSSVNAVATLSLLCFHNTLKVTDLLATGRITEMAKRIIEATK